MKNSIKKEIYNKIKKYDKIVIARHVGADPDALGSTIGLKEIILNTFPNKKVSCIGVYASKFKFMGSLDSLNEEEINESLLIVCDTPDLKRIDGIDDVKEFKDIIKIDHHPEIDKYGITTWVNPDESSVCQMIIELCFDTRLKMTKSAAEKLFMGLVSDTNRFLFHYTTSKTMKLVSRLIEETKIDFTYLYEDLYKRNLQELRFQGYVEENIEVTDNGFAFIKITDKILKKFNVDAGTTGNIIGSLNNVEEILVWVMYTEDLKNNVIKVNARSRGPIINTTLEKFNGGGHMYASGARLKSFDEVEKLNKSLDTLCKKYNKENEEK